jgi:hypothetical protein
VILGRPFLAWLLVTWVALAGVYPLAKPEHGDGTLLATVDLYVHLVATGVLLAWIVEWARSS